MTFVSTSAARVTMPAPSPSLTFQMKKVSSLGHLQSLQEKLYFLFVLDLQGARGVTHPLQVKFVFLETMLGHSLIGWVMDVAS